MDFDKAYRVEGYGGIAWRLTGYETERRIIECEDEDCLFEDVEEVTNEDRVVAYMIGDDRKFTFGVDEVTPIEDEEYCHVCGQIGCTGDGREFA